MRVGQLQVLCSCAACHFGSDMVMDSLYSYLFCRSGSYNQLFTHKMIASSAWRAGTKSQDYELASLQQSWKRLEVSRRGLDHTMYRINDMTINTQFRYWQPIAVNWMLEMRDKSLIEGCILGDYTSFSTLHLFLIFSRRCFPSIHHSYHIFLKPSTVSLLN